MFLSLVIRSVEIYRENQVEIAVFIIPDETWCLRIEQIDVQFLVVDDTDGIHQQSRVEADQDVHAALLDLDVLVQGTEGGHRADVHRIILDIQDYRFLFILTDQQLRKEIPIEAPLPAEEPAGPETQPLPAGKPEQLTLASLDPAIDGDRTSTHLLTREKADRYKYIGQIFDTYWIIEYEKRILIIDQHAAHERVFYERLVGEYLDSEKPGQQLLLPLILEAPVDLESSEYDWLEPLREMGYRIEPFGPRVYRIDTIPTFMSMTEAEGFVKEFMVSLDENETPRNTVVIDKLITKSCKSAVKAHDTLSGPEREALLEQLKRCRNPFSCPHGRPTFIRFTKYEIEKFFKRVQ